MYWDEFGNGLLFAPAPNSDKDTRLWKKFREFDSRNPHMWEEFKRYAFDAVARGYKRIGARLFLHLIRWEKGIGSEGDRFKIRNDWSPYYARKFMLEYPEYNGLFELRKVREK